MVMTTQQSFGLERCSDADRFQHAMTILCFVMLMTMMNRKNFPLEQTMTMMMMPTKQVWMMTMIIMAMAMMTTATKQSLASERSRNADRL
jgi:hypothetical protein